MASKGNFWNELLTDEEPEPAPKMSQKKQEKAQKLQDAMVGQKKSANSKQSQNAAKDPSQHKTPVVDATRPGKRQFDRISGTGRGKEVPKGGHLNWGKTEDVKEFEDAKAEVIDGIKPEFKDHTEVEEKPAKQQKKKPSAPKEPAEPKEPKQPKVVTKTLESYYNQVESQKIHLEARVISKPNEMESSASTKGYVVLAGSDKNAKPRQQNKAAPKKDEKKAEISGKKGKKEEVKKVPEAQGPAKKEKRIEDLTTADFFKRDKNAQPARQPRRQPSERRPREPRQPREAQPLVEQVWRREGDKSVTTTRPIAGSEAPANAQQPQRPAKKQPVVKVADNAFPELGSKKSKAPKEKKAAAPAAGAEQKAKAAAPAKN